MLNINNIMKKYQINYISMGKVVSEMVEAVSRKAARKYMKEIGFEHIKKDKSKFNRNVGQNEL